MIRKLGFSQVQFLLLLFVIISVGGFLLLQYKSVSSLQRAELANAWIRTIEGNQWNNYSQLGEDGTIDTIFKNIGTKDKIYVEFGVEDCQVQCNTKRLRETGWDVKNSLLMDGGHSNPDINLHQVIFWPSNIVKHFERFGVPYTFDLLSVDTDAYDWFMLEAIFKAQYKPRVVVTEINICFDPEDAKSIMLPKDGKSFERWDGTMYHGSSIQALSYMFNRFDYSLVFCNFINCFAVRDDALGAFIRRPFSDIYENAKTHLCAVGHRCDYSNRSMAVIDPSGHWLGDTDQGLGSPGIRHTGCNPGVPDKKPYIEDVPQAEDKPYIS